VSHETIYNAIYAYPRGELKKQLIALLRQGAVAAGLVLQGRIGEARFPRWSASTYVLPRSMTG
jgi:hypothetical protein